MAQTKNKFHALILLNEGVTVSLGEIDHLVSVIWVENKNTVATFTGVDHNENGETYYIFKEVDALLLTASEETPHVIN